MEKIRNLSQLLNALEHGYRIPEKRNVKNTPYYAAHCTSKEERHFCISLAGHIISIDTMNSETYTLCKDYLCECEPDIYVSISEDDIDFERQEAKKANTNQRAAYLETLAVYRKICIALLNHDIFLMHGAVIAEGNNAYLFTAKSGTGKTTHIRKWLENLKNAYVVNGDKPLIKITKNNVLACGTPWCGKESMGMNCMTPLRSIILMERGDHNAIREISFGDAFTILLQQTYHPQESEQMMKTIRLLSHLNGRVKMYQYIFDNMKDDAFSVAYKALTEGKI